MGVSTYTDNVQDLLPSWLTVIGMLTMFWSPIERQIDQCVHLLCKIKPPQSKPLALNKKLKYINDNLPSDIAQKYDIKALIELTKSTVKIRDVCVHGVLESYDQNCIRIGKIDGKRQEPLIEIFTIDGNRLNKAAENLTVLAERWNIIASTLLIES